MLTQWQLAWRFRSNKQQGFISFIAASSTFGIGLGCAVLILLLSVMNGFERELRDKVLAVVPHGELYAVSNAGMEKWQIYSERLAEEPGVERVTPHSQTAVMIQKGQINKAAEITGLTTDYLSTHSLLDSLNEQQREAFLNNPQSIVLGSGIMSLLSLTSGDRVQVLFPKISNDMSMQAPTSKWLTVVGGVSLGGELDQHFGLMHLMTLSEILGVATGAQGIRVQFDDPYLANLAIRQIGNQLDQPMYMSSWYHSHGHLYQDIQLVRTVVYLSLVLLITVACFNIVSSLVMSVNEKQAEIAILKSMGASDTFILHVFVAQGLINGLIGTTVGCLLGCILALNITDWIAALESKSGVELLSGDIYFVDFLPSLLHYNEVALTGLIALSLSVLATLYPARKAAKLPPAQGLA